MAYRYNTHVISELCIFKLTVQTTRTQQRHGKQRTAACVKHLMEHNLLCLCHISCNTAAMAGGENKDISTKLVRYKMLFTTVDIYTNIIQTAKCSTDRLYKDNEVVNYLYLSKQFMLHTKHFMQKFYL
jgi:hypothetical protein